MKLQELLSVITNYDKIRLNEEDTPKHYKYICEDYLGNIPFKTIRQYSEREVIAIVSNADMFIICVRSE